jgi:hypothetical protein
LHSSANPSFFFLSLLPLSYSLPEPFPSSKLWCASILLFSSHDCPNWEIPSRQPDFHDVDGFQSLLVGIHLRQRFPCPTSTSPLMVRLLRLGQVTDRTSHSDKSQSFKHYIWLRSHYPPALRLLSDSLLGLSKPAFELTPLY